MNEYQRSGPDGLSATFCNEDCIQGVRQRLKFESVDLIITDPPYGIEGHTLHKHYNRNEKLVLDGYVEIPADQYGDFSRQWINEAQWALRPGGIMYLVSGWTHLRDILNAVADTSLGLVNHIIWKYNFGVFTKQKFVTSHYHILYLIKTGPRTFDMYSRFGSKEKDENNGSLLFQDMEDVWVINREYKRGQVRHKNQLPTQLLTKMLQYSSREGDLVCDLFGGSFSTAKVAMGMNRSFVGFEIGQEAFAHQMPEIDAVEWGGLIPSLRVGKDDRPKNQLEKWTPELLKELQASYLSLRDEGLSKKAAIDRLQETFERGYFSILNALKRQGL